MFKSCLQIACAFTLILAFSKPLVAEEKKEPVYGGRTVEHELEIVVTRDQDGYVIDINRMQHDRPSCRPV